MQDVQTASEQAFENSSNPDSLFGVCQAIGDDFGFNPLALRLGFLAVGFFSIPASIAAYALLGIGVATSRWLFPRPESQVEDLASNLQPASADRLREPELLAA